MSRERGHRRRAGARDCLLGLAVLLGGISVSLAQGVYPASPQGYGEPMAETPMEPRSRPYSAPPRVSGNALPRANGEPQPPRVTEVRPHVYYMPRQDGQLVPMLGWDLEDFLQSWRDGQNASPTPPVYSLEDFQLTGELKSSREAYWLELSCELTARLRTKGWVRIPLRMQQAVWRVAYDEGGTRSEDISWSRDATDDGIVLHLRGKAGEETRRLRFQAEVPVIPHGDRFQLNLAIPSSLSSRLQFTVPHPRARMEKFENVSRVTTQPAGESSTRFDVDGLSGMIELAWRAPRRDRGRVLPDLDVESWTQFTLTDTSWRAECHLRIQGIEGPVRPVEITLPPEARVLSMPESVLFDARISEKEPMPGAEMEVDPETVLEITPLAEDLRQLEVKLAYFVSLPLDQPQGQVAPQGLHLEGALRHVGWAAAEMEGNWEVRWLAPQHAERVAALPEDALERFGEITPRGNHFWEISRQTFSLPFEFSQATEQTTVQARYQLVIGSETAELSGTLSYAGVERGPRDVEIQWAGWILDEISPSTVEILGPNPTQNGTIISLPTPPEGAETVELQFSAHRQLDARAPRLEFEFPQPVADALLPYELEVRPVSGELVVTPIPDAIKGLSPWQSVPEIEGANEEVLPELRYEGDLKAARFVCWREFYNPQSRVDIVTHVFLDADGTRVDQDFYYHLRNTTLTGLTLRAAGELIQAGELDLRVNGISIEPRHSEQTSPTIASEKELLFLPFKSPRTGELHLRARYSLPASPSSEAAVQGLRSVRLLAPHAAEEVNHELTISTEEDWKVSLVSPGWRAGEETLGSQQRFQTDLPADGIDLEVVTAPGNTSGSTVVDSLVIQSWLSEDIRADRLVCRFQTSDDLLLLQLPEGARTNPTLVRLTRLGQDADMAIPQQDLPETRDGNRRVIQLLPSPGQVQSYRLELIYYLPRENHWPTTLTLPAPEIPEAAWIRRVYWQLFVPDRIHLLSGDRDFLTEHRWQWQGMYWARVTALQHPDFRQISTFVGSSGSAVGNAVLGFPTERVNVYTFSGVGAKSQLEVGFIRRAWLVFGLSSAALLVGLLLAYASWNAYKWRIILGSCVLFALALALPESFPLLLQASCLGAGLAITAKLWAWRASTYPRPRPHRPGGSSIVPMGSTATRMHEEANSGRSSSTGLPPAKPLATPGPTA